jgi:hypothetical protein
MVALMANIDVAVGLKSHVHCWSASLKCSAMPRNWTKSSLDVTFNEDRSRIRKDYAPENMAAVRHVALNLLRQERSQHISLRQKRLLCGLDEHYLLTVLSGAT